MSVSIIPFFQKATTKTGKSGESDENYEEKIRPLHSAGRAPWKILKKPLQNIESSV
jgi:hypothetical protein